MVDDYKWWEVVIAWLKKEANFLSDPRTITTVVAVVASLSAMARLLGWIDREFSDAQIIALLQTTAGLFLALAAFLSVIVSIIGSAIVLVKSWENRPSRGIKPWLTPRG